MFAALFARFFQRTDRTASVAASLWQAVEASLPCLAHLNPEERQALREMALDFLDHKVFSGAADFEPDNFARLSIALQACLPVLKLGLEAYAGWRGIIVYPGDFIIPRREVDENGLLHEYEEDALGESWDGGPVVLSWFDDPADYAGANVVIHEFAHKLDMLAGEPDGMPPLHAGMNVEAWREAFDAAYEDFCQRVDAEENTELDPYAAEHPAEFFAVASEAFFTAPDELFRDYPAVYRQLAAFYRQDPRKATP
ncbi:zinc-dependent peptidase [Uliginosibacterium sp. 31-16]|uniref:M90 family metallopeptidase n=1 Tax=Uliginosibacterium sp. 31-16 TaxID=3068315 RepID=UPI00273D8DF9|nr:M90 family metallopeptidase [Uliginosibacterium sp. 31-16]MDP5241251.1 zinc-dependent peptidase [Uliginosibacterium sp. 31-16]